MERKGTEKKKELVKMNQQGKDLLTCLLLNRTKRKLRCPNTERAFQGEKKNTHSKYKRPFVPFEAKLHTYCVSPKVRKLNCLRQTELVGMVGILEDNIRKVIR